jgi:hypothetical protein
MSSKTGRAVLLASLTYRCAKRARELGGIRRDVEMLDPAADAVAIPMPTAPRRQSADQALQARGPDT